MNEENPFAAPVIKEPRGRKQSALGWIMSGILAVLLTVVVLLWVTALAKQRSLESLRSKLEDASASLETARTESRKGQDQVAALQLRVADLEQEKAAVALAAKSLEDEMRAGLESKDVTISKLQGKLTVNIMDRVMFDSGEAVLKPGGEAVMRKIAALLAEHPELKIHVVGHTDNVPMRNKFASNWELSAARALAAVHFLTEKAGVDPRRVGAVAYGEYRPVADNATAEGRAKNRRIAVTILSDELAGVDAAPSLKPAVGTDLPPVIPDVNVPPEN